MRASSFICIVGVLFTVVDQFYSGINLMRLFLAGFVAVVVLTECERWLRYKLHGRTFASVNKGLKSKERR